MKKKTIIAFFCATFSVCAIYGGLRYTVSSGTSQVTMAAQLFLYVPSTGDFDIQYHPGQAR